MRSYRYVPPGGGREARDHSTLWLVEDGAYLARGWTPPAAVLPGPSGGAKGAVKMSRTQAAWLLRQWRRRVRLQGGTLRRGEEAGR